MAAPIGNDPMFVEEDVIEQQHQRKSKCFACCCITATLIAGYPMMSLNPYTVQRIERNREALKAIASLGEAIQMANSTPDFWKTFRCHSEIIENVKEQFPLVREENIVLEPVQSETNATVHVSADTKLNKTRIHLQFPESVCDANDRDLSSYLQSLKSLLTQAWRKAFHPQTVQREKAN